MTVDRRAADLFARTPVNALLGGRLVKRAADRVEVRAPVRSEWLQEYGIVQGGILTALADTTAVYLIIPEAMDRGAVNGVELKLNFLRPARADGGELVSVATPVRVGRRVAVIAVDIHQDDRHVVHGTFTYLLE